MTNSLIVGANGNIGSALFRHHQQHELPVWGCDIKASEASPSFALNLLNPPSSWLFPDVDFDVAYLCAGICRMALCEEDPTGTRQVNIDGMRALAQLLAKAGTFVIFFSTNQVFNGDKAHQAADAPHAPLNEYGRQKAEMETLIKEYCAKWAIVRLTKVVEPNMMLVKNWIDGLLQNQPVNAFTDMMLAPVSLRQVVETLTLIGQKQQNGIYQISGQFDISYHDLATYLASCLDRPPSLVQPTNSIAAGINKNFLPRFTSLDCSSTIALGAEKPPHYTDVVRECFNIERIEACLTH